MLLFFCLLHVPVLLTQGSSSSLCPESSYSPPNFCSCYSLPFQSRLRVISWFRGSDLLTTTHPHLVSCIAFYFFISFMIHRSLKLCIYLCICCKFHAHRDHFVPHTQHTEGQGTLWVFNGHFLSKWRAWLRRDSWSHEHCPWLRED